MWTARIIYSIVTYFLQHFASAFHSLYRHVLQSLWAEKCQVSYETIFLYNIGSPFFTEEMEAPFITRKKIPYDSEEKGFCNRKISSAAIKIFIKA